MCKKRWRSRPFHRKEGNFSRVIKCTRDEYWCRKAYFSALFKEGRTQAKSRLPNRICGAWDAWRYVKNGAVTFGKTEKVRNDNEKSRKTAKTVNETVEWWNPADFLGFDGLFLVPFSRLDVLLYASRHEKRRFFLKSDYPLIKLWGCLKFWIWDTPFLFHFGRLSALWERVPRIFLCVDVGNNVALFLLCFFCDPTFRYGFKRALPYVYA